MTNLASHMTKLAIPLDINRQYLYTSKTSTLYNISTSLLTMLMHS